MKQISTKVLSRIDNEIRPLKLVTGGLLILQSFLIFFFNFDTSVNLQEPLFNLSWLTGGEAASVTIRIELLIAFYLLIAGVRTFLQATVLYEGYREHITKEISTLRWVEYGVSSPIMVIVVAILLGINQITLLGTIFVAMATVIYLGYRIELAIKKNQKDAAIVQYILGVIVQTIVFGVLLHSAFSSPDAIVSQIGGFILFSALVIFFVTFPGIMIFWLNKYKIWKDYITVEFSYIVASYFAKTGLAALVTVTLLLY